MEVIYPRCAGLDVHKQTVVACVRIAGDGAPLQEVRTFATTTSGLLALADWLDSLRRRARRDGGHRRVLEAGVARARRPLRAGAGQRRAREERARAQDRRQRRDVAGRPAGPWPDPRQLRAAGCRAGAAHAHAHAQAVRARARRVTSSASRRCWKTPTSSSASCSATSWARAAAPCCKPSSTATATPNRCLLMRSDASRPAAPSCSKRCAAASAPITASCSSCTWSTSMRSTRPSPPSNRRWALGLKPFRKPPSC